MVDGIEHLGGLGRAGTRAHKGRDCRAQTAERGAVGVANFNPVEGTRQKVAGDRHASSVVVEGEGVGSPDRGGGAVEPCRERGSDTCQADVEMSAKIAKVSGNGDGAIEVPPHVGSE